MNQLLQRSSGRPTSEPSDHSLLRRVKDGKQDAADALYYRYANRLIALARKNSSPELAAQVDSDEIVQSVFGSFFRGAQQGYYDIPEGEELWKLLLVISFNKIRTKVAYHRAAMRDSRLTVTSNELDYRTSRLAAGEIASRELHMTIDDALCTMPDDYRKIVSLRIEGHTVGEVAQRVKRSKRTVERILQEVRGSLSNMLDES